MLSFFRNQHRLRTTVLLVMCSLAFQVFTPVVSFALTSGPGTPEVSSFEPVGTSELVDVSSGDFVYNIPLMDIEGYPINLAYHSGITMDQEASYVGLGWNLNVGSINRQIRGLPDDFNGDKIQRTFNMRPNWTVGVNTGFSPEAFGYNGASLRLQLGLFYNNYKGLGYEFTISPALSLCNEIESEDAIMFSEADLNLSFNFNSQSGVGLIPSTSFSAEKIALTQNASDGNLNVSSSSVYNSRRGLQDFTLNYSSSIQGNSNSFLGKMMSYGIAGNYGHSFARPTFTPQISTPFINASFEFRLGAGGEAFWADIKGELAGYYSEQWVASNELEKEGYGYLYSHQAHDNSLMDLSRELDGAFVKGATKFLPVPTFSYDTYLATGQGLAGQFRPHRGDVGILHDDKTANHSVTGNLSAEIGAGALFDAGGSVNLVYANSHSGPWTGTPTSFISPDDEIGETAIFRGKDDVNDPLYEPAYFKQVGDVSGLSANTHYQNIGEDELVRVRLGNWVNHQAKNILEDGSGATVSSGVTDYTREERTPRNNVFQALTAEEASIYGNTTQIELFPEPNGLGNQAPNSPISRVSSVRKAHHLSELSVIRADGMRYTYGLPAYNLSKEEVTFNVGEDQVGPLACSGGIVEYTDGVDNSVDNERGEDHFFDRTQTPAYVYANLLTSVVSADYVDSDVTEGPSDGDLGAWTKINYWQADASYGWRTPFVDAGSGNTGYANLNHGYLGNDEDDKASYVYGEKEIYYVHSIESKHYVAEFLYGERDDAYGVENSRGEMSSTNGQRRLEKITLYSKQDRQINGANAVPVKTVHFQYDYSLCPGVPNNPTYDGGKLTLRKVWFTYGRSEEAKLNPYIFVYGDPDHNNHIQSPGIPLDEIYADAGFNPSYDPKAYDRWGNYMPEDESDLCNPDKLNNASYPYVSQELATSAPYSNLYSADVNEDWRLADAYAQAWHLSSVLTPSGGRIDVFYESKDYGYVQDKQAMEMFEVLKFGTSSSYSASSSGDNLYDQSSFNADDSYVFVKLRESGVSTTDFREKYLPKTDNNTFLYMNVRVNLGKNETDMPEFFERVPVYAQIDRDNSGISAVGSGNIGYIKLEKVGMVDDGSKMISPVAFAAMNYLKMNRPDYLYNPQAFQNPSSNITDLGYAVLGFANEMKLLFQQYYRFLAKGSYCQKADPSQSWVRLNSPDKRKHGGGSRVFRIEMRDNWQAMAGSPHSDRVYGQTYEYEIEDDFDPSKMISSGVAAYEPYIGADENPFKQPIFFSERLVGVPDGLHYVEAPIGESYYPGPSIIYRRVKVSSLRDAAVNQNATGHTVQEFYTAKDFPTIVRSTNLDTRYNPLNGIFKFLKISSKEYLSATQGYAIYRNDMHGKPKAQKVYAEGKSKPISKVEYFYRTKANRRYPRELNNNQVPLIRPNGDQYLGTFKKEVELILDGRESGSEVIGVSLSANINTAVLPFPPIPIPVPSLWPTPQISQTRFRSMVATKVIDSYGILERVVATDVGGSSVETKNLAWDEQTGEVLLTETSNEFKDPLYSLDYPAHWAYEGMGQAYQNIYADLSSVDFDNASSEELDILVKGDELMIWPSSGSNPEKGWILDVDQVNDKIYVIDEDGNLFSSGTYHRVLVIRSGHRNQAATSMASVASKDSPINGGSISPSNTDDILSAGAVVYSDVRRLYGGLFGVNPPPTCTGPDYPVYQNTCFADYAEGEIVNPFLLGLRGSWYPLRSYTYLTEREIGANDIRTDGTLLNFTPFYEWSASAGLFDASPTNWTWTEQVSKFSNHGYSIESENALGVYSSALYGHHHQVPIAVAANARYSEIANENFEFSWDLGVAGCEIPHLQLSIDGDFDIDQYVTQQDAHSGDKSLLLEVGNELVFSHEITEVQGVPNTSKPYELEKSDYSSTFSPEASTGSQEYLISFWIKDDSRYASSDVLTPDNYLAFAGGTNIVTATICNDGTTMNLDVPLSYGPIIEGWQQLTGVLTFPQAYAGAPFTIRIKVADATYYSNPNAVIYLDDLRIHPMDASMKTYVYRNRDLRLMAVGDENNFMQFYQYNSKGELTGIKVETEDGIKTIKETRYNASTIHNQ